jgi:hypothetical protein
VQQSALHCAQAQQAAAAEQHRLTALHNQQLQQQAVDACRGALAGGCALLAEWLAGLSASCCLRAALA